jgi:hypothetical protein
MHSVARYTRLGKSARVVFPPNEGSALTLNPGEDYLDEPVPLVAAQPSAILCLRADAIGTMRSDHLGALFAHRRVELVTVVGAIAEQSMFVVRRRSRRRQPQRSHDYRSAAATE